MKVDVRIKAVARDTRHSGEQPPLDIDIRLLIEGASRGDGVAGTVSTALGEANKAVAKVLETRRY